MKRIRVSMAALFATALMALTVGTAAAHNAGCVQTGTGEWVFVGSNNSSPAVPVQNPRSSDDPPREGNFLDLTPETTGDQYGARFAVDQGQSAVELPSNCTSR